VALEVVQVAAVVLLVQVELVILLAHLHHKEIMVVIQLEFPVLVPEAVVVEPLLLVELVQHLPEVILQDQVEMVQHQLFLDRL
jgi:hypothetical protein